MSDGERNHALDGLRGYAAVAVIGYHSILPMSQEHYKILLRPINPDASWYNLAVKASLIVLNGEVAVGLFFILSGAVLFQSLSGRDGSRFRSGVAFAARRVLRIMPTLLVSLAATFIAFQLLSAVWPFLPRYTFKQFLENAALVKSTLNGASWTLQAELLAVPVILLAAAAWRLFGAWALAAVLAYAFASLFDVRLVGGFVTARVAFVYFAFGFMVPVLGGHVCRWLGVRTWPLLLVAMLLVQHVLPHSETYGFAAQAALGFLLVSVLFHGPAGGASPVLTGPLPQHLGRISYSLYLWNVPILTAVVLVMKKAGLDKTAPFEAGLLAFLVITALALPIARWSERRLEKPSIAVGRRLTRWLLARRPSPAAMAPWRAGRAPVASEVRPSEAA